MTPADIRSAQARIAAHLRHTPVGRMEAGAFGLPALRDGALTLKLELLQHAGSFSQFVADQFLVHDVSSAVFSVREDRGYSRTSQSLSRPLPLQHSPVATSVTGITVAR